MGYLPIFLNVHGWPCLVVGGGETAERKVRALVAAKAEVTVVSPDLTAGLGCLVKDGRIRYLPRGYRAGDVRGCRLVYAATDDRQLQRQIAGEAGRLGVLVNSADAPELCSFIAPAVVDRGDLKIAISTSGASPAFAKRIRCELESRFGPEYAVLIELLRAARSYLRSTEVDGAKRAVRLSALASANLAECIGIGDLASVERILGEHLGEGVNLETLGLGPRRFEVARQTNVPR